MNMTRHKHLKLDQSKIDRAKKLLGAKTEQDTIEQALDLVLSEEPMLKAHREDVMAGPGLASFANRDGKFDGPLW